MNHFSPACMATLFVLMSVWFFYIGGIVLIKRRPLIVKAYQLMFFILLSFSPVILLPLTKLPNLVSTVGPKAYLILLLSVPYVLLLFFLKTVIKGYIVYGVTQDSLRTPLLCCLRQMGLDFEETIYGIVVKPNHTIIQCMVQPQTGTAQLSCEKINASLLDDIMLELKKYYASTQVEIASRGSVFNCILGVFMLCFSIIFVAIPAFGIGNRDKIQDALENQLIKSFLADGMKDIEFYKLRTGSYPESLDDLDSLQKSGSTRIYTKTFRINGNTKFNVFHYEKIGDEGYYLFSPGSDGLPFTDDDIFSEIKPSVQIGYRKPADKNLQPRPNDTFR